MIRSAKFILKPSKKQEELLKTFFGMSRFAYNKVLSWVKESAFGTYEIKNGKNKAKIPSLMELQGCSTKLKEKYRFSTFKGDLNGCFTQSNA